MPNKIIPNVIWRIDAITEAIAAGDHEEAVRLCFEEYKRLDEKYHKQDLAALETKANRSAVLDFRNRITNQAFFEQARRECGWKGDDQPPVQPDAKSCKDPMVIRAEAAEARVAELEAKLAKVPRLWGMKNITFGGKFIQDCRGKAVFYQSSDEVEELPAGDFQAVPYDEIPEDLR